MELEQLKNAVAAILSTLPHKAYVTVCGGRTTNDPVVDVDVEPEDYDVYMATVLNDARVKEEKERVGGVIEFTKRMPLEAQ